MKQVSQNYKTGQLKVDEVPEPAVKPAGILVRTSSSLISLGTERTKIEAAKMSIVEKAFSRLDLVKTVFNNLKQEGVALTVKKALNKLDTPISLGYTCAGEVTAVGEAVKGLAKGGRVACVGEGFAAHSQINYVPEDMAAAMPCGVSYDEAAFSGLGAIALNAVELAQLMPGEKAAVIGLGLIGQIAVQIIKAKGLEVLGADIDPGKIDLAAKLGVTAAVNPLNDDMSAHAKDFSQGLGLDAVIITASSSNSLVLQMAGEITRNKGRVILVGAMPITIPRKHYYEKELTFIISRGFGADLYYKEKQGRQYPYGYRPLTTKQNMLSFLELVEQKKVDVSSLISHRFDILDAEKAYELIKSNSKECLGVLFNYNKPCASAVKIDTVETKAQSLSSLNIGFIGAGSFAQGYLLPALKKVKDTRFKGVAAGRGISAKSTAGKFGFDYCCADYREIVNDKDIDTVFIVTRHNLHAEYVISALGKGKNVFVEKPLCLNEQELDKIISAYSAAAADKNKLILMTGFNRRFSVFSREIKKFFNNRCGPLMINYRVNAGCLPPEHWVHDFKQGGGRIIGEVCHFIDLLQYFTNAVPVEVFTACPTKPWRSWAGPARLDKGLAGEDNILATLRFSDGSIGAINYNSIGDVSYPREYIEIFGQNSVAVIDNFKSAVLSRAGVSHKVRKIGRDMGHDEEVRCFADSVIKGGPAPIPFKDIVSTTSAAFKMIESLERNMPVQIPQAGACEGKNPALPCGQC